MNDYMNKADEIRISINRIEALDRQLEVIGELDNHDDDFSQKDIADLCAVIIKKLSDEHAKLKTLLNAQ